MDYLKINKESWNKRTEVHYDSEFYDNDNFKKTGNSLNEIELEFLKEIKGKKILHLQCHFGQDSISLSKLGAEVTGVDLSDLAIEAYLSESTLKRTIKNIERSSEKDQSDQINMTKLYIYEATQIVQKKSRDVINSIIDTQNQEDLYSSILEKLHYSENPNIFDLKTRIANKIISENKYCF